LAEDTSRSSAKPRPPSKRFAPLLRRERLSPSVPAFQTSFAMKLLRRVATRFLNLAREDAHDMCGVADFALSPRDGQGSGSVPAREIFSEKSGAQGMASDAPRYFDLPALEQQSHA
jgi:hypothetical protein